MAPSKRDSKGHEKAEKASRFVGKVLKDLVSTTYDQEELKKRKVAKWLDKLRLSLQRKIELSSIALFNTSELPERIASITAKIEAIGAKTELLKKDAENRTVAFGTTLQVVKSMLDQQANSPAAAPPAVSSSTSSNGRAEVNNAKRGVRDHLSSMR